MNIHSIRTGNIVTKSLNRVNVREVTVHPVIFLPPAPSAPMGNCGGRKLIHVVWGQGGLRDAIIHKIPGWAAVSFLKNGRLHLRCRQGLLDAYLIMGYFMCPSTLYLIAFQVVSSKFLELGWWWCWWKVSFRPAAGFAAGKNACFSKGLCKSLRNTRGMSYMRRL